MAWTRAPSAVAFAILLLVVPAVDAGPGDFAPDVTVGAGPVVVSSDHLFTTIVDAYATGRQTVRDGWGDVHETLWDPSLYTATDVIDESGIDFVHAGFRQPGKLGFMESTAGGACWGDYDNDGLLDLYVTDTLDDAGRGMSRLYQALGPTTTGDWTFRDATTEQGVGIRGLAQACVWGDYDNDGWQDLYVTTAVTGFSTQGNVLFRNLGEGRGFEDVTDAAGVDGRTSDGAPCNAPVTGARGILDSVNTCWSMSAAWLDHDVDGDLDLYVTNYVEFGIGACVVIHPSNPKVCTGQPNRLYRNNGDGTFTDVARAAGVAVNGQGSLGRSLGVVAGDINTDGWPDLYVANDQDANALYINKGDGTFVSVARTAGVDNSGLSPQGERHRAGMGVEAQDFNGDGLVDLLSTHFKGEQDALYLNTGKGWDEVTRDWGVGRAVQWDESRWGGGYVDMNMDGMRDYLVVAGGVVEGRPGPIHLYLNNGTAFERQHEPLWPYVKNHRANHRAAAFADYDNDGDHDVYVSTLMDDAGRDGRPKLLRFGPADGGAGSDELPRHRWLRVELEGTDTTRDGYGATVIVVTASGWVQQHSHVSGGSYAGSSDPRPLFSLRNSTSGEVLVQWPGGETQGPIPFDLGGASDLSLTIKEENRRPPAAPDRLEVTEGADSARLTWAPTLATDFAAYRVWRSATNSFEDAELVEEITTRGTSSLLVDLPAEGKSTFWVTTVDQGGLTSEPSPATTAGQEVVERALPTPTWLVAAALLGGAFTRRRR